NQVPEVLPRSISQSQGSADVGRSKEQASTSVEVASGRRVPVAEDLTQLGSRDFAAASSDAAPNHRDDKARTLACIYACKTVWRIVRNCEKLVDKLYFAHHRETDPHVLIASDGQACVESTGLPQR